MTIPEVPEALTSVLRQGHRFLLTSHVNPDGDAIGSAVGLSRVLHKLGKGTTIWSRDPAPRVYHALPGAGRIHTGVEAPKGFPETFDAAIVLECPSPDRTGLAEEISTIDVINIDHHLGNEHYGKVNWVETAAPAVGEMVFRLARSLNVTIDADTANALYLTLVTDTGGFRFSNATPQAFEAAADLVRTGASPETVTTWLYESQPESAVRLLGEMLRSLKLHAGGRLATVWVTQEMMERSDAMPGDTEGLIDHPRAIGGVSAVALFRELPSGEVKVSLRSRGEVSVETLARQNGGGGHRNAAGFTAVGESSHDELEARTMAALEEALSVAQSRRDAEGD